MLRRAHLLGENNMRKLYLILLVCISLFSAVAQDSPAFILTTADYALQDKWNTTLSDSGHKLLTAEKAVRLQNIFVIPFISVKKTNGEENAVTYDIEVTGPDGNIYFTKKNNILTEMKLMPNKLYMARDFPFFTFQKNDLNGEYFINVLVHNKQNNENTQLTARLELVDSIKPDEQFKSDAEFQKWLNTYYLNMNPHRFIDAIQYFVNSPMSNSGSYWPIFGFFNEILSNNEFLRHHLIDNFYSFDQKTRQFIMRQLYFTKDEYSFLFLLNISGEDAETVEEMKKNPPTILNETLYHPTQINYLWGMFFASGRLDPIAMVIDSLNLKNENTEVYTAALTSLKQNYTNYRLVKEYVDFALEYVELSEVQKEALSSLTKE